MCRLREAALAEVQCWYVVNIPYYACLECIGRGRIAFHKRVIDRILGSDQVNRLVSR